MSDGFALAALSYALRNRIQQWIGKTTDVAQTGQFDIVTRAPEQLAATAPGRVTMTVYPWKLVPNPGWASSRGTAYGPRGERRDSPLLALDAYYVLAGYAPATADADAVLGWAMLAMHETPRISRELMQSLANGVTPASSPLGQALRDLADQPAPIAIEPVSYELEEFSQVWSTLNCGARSGMIYRVGTLLIESRHRAASAPPVREGRLSVSQLRAPQIARMLFASSAADRFSERALATPGEVLRLEGSGLKGDITHVAFGDVVVPADPARLRSDQLELDVPSGLRPGVVTLQVRHDWPKPAGKLPPPANGTIPGERSNLLPLAIRPVLRTNDPFTIGNRQEDADQVVSFDVTAHFAVSVGSLQRVELLLNATAAGPDGRYASFAFTASPPAPGVPDTNVANRQITIQGVRAGAYLARVVVDGAESALREDGTGVAGPLLAVPA